MKKSIVFIFDVLSENVINFVRMRLYLPIKNIVSLRKTVAFFFDLETFCAYTTVPKCLTTQIPIMQFNTLT